jgi:predicted RecB family nuclease
MLLSASAFYTLRSPSKCERRVFLRAHGEQEAAPSPFDELLQELGRRHETEHLSQFDEVLDLSEGTLEERIERTKTAIANWAPVIYQGVLRSSLARSNTEVVGIPDFLIKDGQSYGIRDCKLSRKVSEEHHSEVIRQLELYGWLFEQTMGKAPAGLEVYLGDRSVLPLPYSGATDTLAELEFILSLSTRADEPYSPVGWSKCSGCGFRERCWKIAEDQRDVALVFELDQGTALQLHREGIATISGLLKSHTKESLSQLVRPYGSRMQKVGKKAERILLQAEAMASNKTMKLADIALPTNPNVVMFDLEGLPPQFDELDKVYLWGTQVYGKDHGSYLPALAGFGAEGERDGWLKFMENSRSIFEKYGDIPFVHWAQYETIKLKSYIQRFGDPSGIGQRVLDNCVDLLKITRDTLVLPDQSYSLKVVEKRVGFKRTMDEYGGNWSIVQYIRAVETQDEALRDKIMSDILKYNEEDLQATWAVFQWIKGYETHRETTE